MKSSWLCGNT